MTTSLDRTLALWDLRTRRRLWSVAGLGGFAYAVSLKPEDPFAVAVACGDGTVRAADPRIGFEPTTSEAHASDSDNVLWRGLVQTKTTCMAWYPADDDGDEPHPRGVLRSRFGRRPRRRRRSRRRGRRAIRRPTRLPRWTGHPRAVGVSQPWSVERPACPGARHLGRRTRVAMDGARVPGRRGPGPPRVRVWVGRRGVRGRHHAFSRRRHDGRDDHVRVHGRRRVRRGRVERRVRHDPSPRRFGREPERVRVRDGVARDGVWKARHRREVAPGRDRREFAAVRMGRGDVRGRRVHGVRPGGTRGSIRAEMSPGSSRSRVAASFGERARRRIRGWIRPRAGRSGGDAVAATAGADGLRARVERHERARARRGDARTRGARAVSVLDSTGRALARGARGAAHRFGRSDGPAVGP